MLFRLLNASLRFANKNVGQKIECNFCENCAAHYTRNAISFAVTGQLIQSARRICLVCMYKLDSVVLNDTDFRCTAYEQENGSFQEEKTFLFLTITESHRAIFVKTQLQTTNK